jgi:hypothetical protein
MMIGDRERHCDLTIVLLAELAAILAGNADRMPSFLWETGIVDDPGFDRSVPLNARQHHLSNLAQNGFIRPGRLANEMKKRLMLARRSRRRRHRRQRFYALAICRQH